MKKLILVCLFIQSGFLLKAQDKTQYLEVKYEMQVKIELEQVLEQVPAQWRSAVQDQLKQEIGKGIFMDYTLKTNGVESEYKMDEKISNSQSGGGMIASQITAMDKDPLYKNIKENYYLKAYDFGKAYIIKDSLMKFDWKISKEKEEIAGFDAYKATGVMSDSIQVTAWYTPKLNFKDGPDRLWGLPGLILKAEYMVNNADLVVTAVNVAVKEEEMKIKVPSKGKIVTEEEFMAEMKKIQEQYKDMYGGGVDSE